MKTNRNTIASIVTAALTLFSTAATSHAANRALVLLNSAAPIVSRNTAFHFESLAAGRYQQFVNLSDANCTRAKLLDTLILQTRAGRTIDLVVLGHGSDNTLLLHNSERLTGMSVQLAAPGSLRTLLTQAKTREGASFAFKLRLVCMSNSFSNTLNDDWRAIGARVSVGCEGPNFLPEPMTSIFWDGFVKEDKRVIQAASDASVAAPPAVGSSHFTISGDGNIIFKDECQLAFNEQRTVTVQGNRTHTFPGIFLVAGQRYTYSASGTWKSTPFPFFPPSNASGYSPGVFDGNRRHSSNMMCLVGELFPHNYATSPSGVDSKFRIGAGRTITAGGHGFLNLFANDDLDRYVDNTGSVSVTIKRIQ